MRKTNELDSRLYGSLLTDFAKDLNIDFAMFIIQEMENYDIPMNTRTYNNLIKLFMKTNHETKAISLYKKLISCGTPTVVTYSILLDAYAKQHNTKKVLYYFDQMKIHNVIPDAYIYTTIISMYASNGDTQQVCEWLSVMEENKVALTVVTCNVILQFFATKGYIKHCLAVVKVMGSNKVRFDIATESILTKFLSNCIFTIMGSVERNSPIVEEDYANVDNLVGRLDSSYITSKWEQVKKKIVVEKGNGEEQEGEVINKLNKFLAPYKLTKKQELAQHVFEFN